MDSLTLTSVYTYAMITICADSWNSRSVLWPMIFFGTAKFPWEGTLEGTLVTKLITVSFGVVKFIS